MSRFQTEASAWPRVELFDTHKTEFPNWKTFAQVCAIIHDVGHGPYSHFVESFLQWTDQVFRTNEEIGEDVIKGRYLKIDKELAPKATKFLSDVLEEIANELGFSVDDLAYYVTSEDSFNRKFNGPPKNEPRLFIRKLISSPADMDRVDFLNRDSYFVGLKGGVDAHSIIQNLALYETDLGSLDLVLEEAGIPAVEALLTSRDLMYATVYHHPVERWGLASILRSAYILHKDYSIPAEYILRQTDETLLSMLQRGDDYTIDIASRIVERRPYNRVFELEFSYLNLRNLPNEEEVIKLVEELERDPGKLREVEEIVESNSARSEKVDVIIDLPPPMKFLEAGVKVKVAGELSPIELNRVSDLACYINERKKERRWIMNVFTNASPGSPSYEEIVSHVKKELKIPDDAHPTKLIRA